MAYVIGVGSNMRVPGIGSPAKVVAAAQEALSDRGFGLVATSRTMASAPLGPSRRRYANAAVLVHSTLAPPDMLMLMQEIEAEFGRERRGRRWGARTLDLDLILWSGGAWRSPSLIIPHPAFRERAFVIRPAAEVAPDWRDPVSGLTLRQLAARVS